MKGKMTAEKVLKLETEADCEDYGPPILLLYLNTKGEIVIADVQDRSCSVSMWKLKHESNGEAEETENSIHLRIGYSTLDRPNWP